MVYVAGSIETSDDWCQCMDVLETKNLRKFFPIRTGFIFPKVTFLRAVDAVDISVKQGEIMGLAGESGCGKSTLGKLILGLLRPDAGEIFFNGKPVVDFDRSFRRQTGIVFQDPFESLNPRKNIFDTLAKPITFHKISGTKESVQARVADLLSIVGLTPPDKFMYRHPHELSGGQRQRVAIARAIAANPIFIVADEPVSALDVSVRAQILSLFKDLQRKLDLAFMLITHELAVLRSLAQRVSIMYLGQIVEVGETRSVFERPRHPYTEALLSATPIPDPKVARARHHVILKGEPPSPIDPPSGCHFHTRCPYAKATCSSIEPLLESREGRTYRCHYPLS